MDISITTPALLFPAISLLLLAFTNRFLALASLIRQLHASYKSDPDEILFGQIANLRYRINLIRDMQAYGVSSLLLCVVCMLVLFAGWVVTTGANGVGSGNGSCETVPVAETRKARTPWALARKVVPLKTVIIVSVPVVTAVAL